MPWLEEHGGDPLGAARRWGAAPGALLDLSASLNPFGPPPGVLRAAARSLRRGDPSGAVARAAAAPGATAYPPRDGSPLRESLSARLGVPAECCLLANGGAEAIHLLVRAAAPRRLVVLTPCFGEYARAAAALDIPVAAVALAPERGFAVGPPEVECLGRLLRPGDLLFLANPNNPTGRLVPPGALASLVELAGEGRALLAVDEAFLPLAAGESASLARRAAAGDPVAVVGSLTKVYALPGLRLGYLVGAPALLAEARRRQPPWAVNSVAIAAGLACLEADAGGGFARRSRERLAGEREWLRRRLRSADHVALYPSEANFLLLRAASPRLAAGPAAALARLGVLVRDCSSFPGLGPSFLRAAVGRRPANRRFSDALLALG